MFFKVVLFALYATIFIDGRVLHRASRSRFNHTSVPNEQGVLNNRIPAITSTETTKKSSRELCHVTVLLDGVSVDCSSRGLVTIPKLPKSSTFIRLDRNDLTNISTKPFLGMTILQTLNLSYNPLEYISPDIFKGLVNLRYLYIAKSKLYKQDGLDLKYLFSDLKQLRILCFTFKFCNLEISFQNVSSLKVIPVLEIDGILMKYLSLPENEPSVAMTTVLTLRSNYVCQIRLEKKYFSMFTSLKRFKFYMEGPFLLFHHPLPTVENDSFNALHQLEELGLNCGDCYCVNRSSGWVDQFIHNVSTSVARLNRLRVLSLEQISCQHVEYSMNCTFALSELALSKSLTRINLNNNAFTMLRCLYIVKPFFPQSLVYLDLRDNRLNPIAFLTLISLYPNIEYIDARYQTERKVYAQLGQRKFNDQPYHNSSYAISCIGKDQYYQSSLREIYFSHSNDPYHYWYTSHANVLYVNLTRMEYSWLRDFKGYSLFLSSIFFDKRPVLNFLDVTGSGIDHIAINAFRNASHLKTLQMSSNALGKMGYNLSRELTSISTLQVLNIANNGISVFTKEIFISMTNLSDLDVSLNHLTEFLPSVQHMNNLRLLNISYNYLQLLSSKTQKDLDKIRTTSDIKVDMTGNPILCTCQTLHFLKWMKNTKVELLNKHNYSCSHSDGRILFMGNIDSIINSLDSRCASITVLAVVLSASVALCITGISSGLAYRYRWRVRYLYYIAKLRFTKNIPEYERLFDYDAFISYANEDFQIARKGCMDNLENECGLRLCIHERDFRPGEAIAFNISVGIHSSKKTVLFISESFLQSKWCKYELNIARMESLYTERAVLLIVILETSVINKLPLDVLDLIRTVTYLEYPEHDGEDDVMIFWRKLAEFIKR